ncbi:MAG: hypothetical protein L6R35_001665 [Caloplaca aegaea]|nr:MAG: hypothetical protein L6R35_001665 [Caloplaca aegaea]
MSPKAATQHLEGRRRRRRQMEAANANLGGCRTRIAGIAWRPWRLVGGGGKKGRKAAREISMKWAGFKQRMTGEPRSGSGKRGCKGRTDRKEHMATSTTTKGGRLHLEKM